MQPATLLLAGLASLAAAVPLAADPNVVAIQNLSVRKNNGTQAASFTIAPAGAKCSQTDSTALVYPRMTECTGGAYNYYFQISELETADTWNLTITREVGMNSVVNGSLAVPTYCRAGGNGANDYVCSQVGNSTTVLNQRFGTN
ncbi:major allergen alt [Diplodia corticola]|uniref:Major allergen alt n=1 Tax=Diplodia corticola TaxID=236234 RepID=A0A1J9QPZ8_9PEZI|nr:major allergen alt [Diplodia corticola]OJD30536.1 major allergen alt [Diplodia corticola]